MKLSIVIICWNDLKVIADCLKSIYGQPHQITHEVIVSDNGSVDGSVEFVRANFPDVRLFGEQRESRFRQGEQRGHTRVVGAWERANVGTSKLANPPWRWLIVIAGIPAVIAVMQLAGFTPTRSTNTSSRGLARVRLRHPGVGVAAAPACGTGQSPHCHGMLKSAPRSGSTTRRTGAPCSRCRRARCTCGCSRRCGG